MDIKPETLTVSSIKSRDKKVWECEVLKYIKLIGIKNGCYTNSFIKASYTQGMYKARLVANITK